MNTPTTTAPADELALRGHASADVVVCDLDSTLTDTRQRRQLCPTVDATRSWLDYAKAAGDDAPLTATVTLLQMLHTAGFAIHILTWRPEAVRELSTDWLRRHRVPFRVLCMRTEADGQDSTAFKTRYVHTIRAVGLNPVLFLDDWPATVTAVIAIGVPVLCVDPCYSQPAPVRS